jgi:cell division protein FtsX
VGASNLIIRLPFILEGMLQGGGAALFGVAALWLLYFAGGRGLQLPGLLAGFVPVFLDRDTVWLLFGAGMFLGAAGSLSRLHDFLRV